MYIVIETRKHNGKVQTFTSSYATKPEAESAFYEILTKAAVSDIDVHSATILNERGFIEKCQNYIHNEDAVDEE